MNLNILWSKVRILMEQRFQRGIAGARERRGLNFNPKVILLAKSERIQNPIICSCILLYVSMCDIQQDTV